MDETYKNRIATAVEYIRSQTAAAPSVAVILGSGLGSVGDAFEGQEIPYIQIPGMPVSTVTGHRGVLKIGPQAAFMIGRFHYYEGWSMQDVVFPLYVLKALGVKTVILTNAAGGVADGLQPGDLVLIKDHINLMGTNPLIGPNDAEFGPRFFDMTTTYTPSLRQLVQKLVPDVLHLPRLREGVYAGFTGPNYETPAEIRMLKVIGADLVGMSTVPEALTARYLGLEILGISTVTNLAAGLGSGELNHAEVVEVGKQVEASMKALLAASLKALLVRKS